MILIDTCSWIHSLRRNGDPAVRERVQRIVLSGEAAWCPQVRLELWNGVGSDEDRQTLKRWEQTLPELDITPEVWELACELASRCRAKGRTVPHGDVVIAACARHHGVAIETTDKHFEWLTKL